MADIIVNKGQGINQTIASNLGLSKDDCKKIKLSTWQSAKPQVNGATKSLPNKNGSIFGGGNNVQSIGDKSTLQSNFKVQAGKTMQINDLKQLLTPAKAEAAQATAGTSETEAASQISQTRATAETSSVSSVSQAGSVSETSGVYKSENKVIVENTPLEGDVQTGRAAAQTLDEMALSGKGEIAFTSDEWRELAAKKDKTPEDIQQLNTEYNTNIKKLGNSMTKYISQAFANGGDIDSAAFMKYQTSGAMDLSGLTAQEQAQLKASNETAFNRIDIKGDGKIDENEMSAYMHALDFDDKNRMGGVITSEDYDRAATQLDDPNRNMLDTKIAYCYNKLYGSEEQ